MRITQFCFICGITAFSPFFMTLTLFTYLLIQFFHFIWYSLVSIVILNKKQHTEVEEGEGRVPALLKPNYGGNVRTYPPNCFVCLFIVAVVHVKLPQGAHTRKTIKVYLVLKVWLSSVKYSLLIISREWKFLIRVCVCRG